MENEFIEKFKNLNVILTETLKKAKERYNIDDTELQTEIDKIEEDDRALRNEPNNLKDIFRSCTPALQFYFIEFTKAKLQTLRSVASVTLLNFLMGDDTIRLRPKEIFTEIKVIKGGTNYTNKNIPCTKLLTEVEKDTDNPQALIVSSQAGGGKSTLVSLIMEEWLDEQDGGGGGGKGQIEGLSQFDLILHVQCRNRNITSLAELLKELVPNIDDEYISKLIGVLKDIRLLILVDGIDELNYDSKKLMNYLIKEFSYAKKCTFLLTTRPAARQKLCDIFGSIACGKYDRKEFELDGIPAHKRADFVRLYCKGIAEILNKRNKEVPTSIEEIVRKVESEKDKEHYKVPINLVMLTWLFLCDDSKKHDIITQTELYYHTHMMCKQKLVERQISNHQSDREDVKEALNKVLPELYKKSLEALLCEELELPLDAVKDHESVHGGHINEKELMGAFFNCHTYKKVSGNYMCYSAPHKGLLELYGALYVVNEINDDATIETVLEYLDGSVKENLPNYQNFIRQIAGVLGLYFKESNKPVPAERAKEVVGLLSQAGISTREAWLDIVEDSKLEVISESKENITTPKPGPSTERPPDNSPSNQLLRVETQQPQEPLQLHSQIPSSEESHDYLQDISPPPPNIRVAEIVIKEIARYFADADEKGDDIMISNTRIKSYTQLLYYLKDIACIKVDITGDDNQFLDELLRHINDLVPQLVKHRCIELKLGCVFYSPRCLQDKLPTLKDYLSGYKVLEVFMGQLCDNTRALFRPKISSTLTTLHLAVFTDDQAVLLSQLKELTNLRYLGVNVRCKRTADDADLPGVNPKHLKPLPDITVNDGESNVHLHLSDVVGGKVDWAIEAAAALKPQPGFRSIRLPRATIKDIKKWKNLLQGLAPQVSVLAAATEEST